MSERLRPRDLAFLGRGVPDHPAAQRDGRDLRPRRLRVRLRPPRRADPRPDLVRAALPPAGRRSSRAGWPTRSGSTTTTSTSATTYAAPRCRDRARPTSCASWSRGSSPARSTAAGRCGRSTSSRGSSDGRVALLYKTHQVLVDGVETVDLGQVLLDKDARAPADRTPTTGARSGAVVHGLVAGAFQDAVTDPATRARHGPRRPWLGPADRGRGRLAGERGRRRADRPAARRRQPAGRPPLAAAPGGHRPDRRWPTTARSARRTAARSTTSSWPPSPARCVPG